MMEKEQGRCKKRGEREGREEPAANGTALGRTGDDGKLDSHREKHLRLRRAHWRSGRKKTNPISKKDGSGKIGATARFVEKRTRGKRKRFC